MANDKEESRPASAGRWWTGVAAGGAMAFGLSLVAGIIDGVYALTHAAEVEAGFLGMIKVCLYSAGLFVPLTLPLALMAGVVMGALPWDVGPGGAWRGLRHLAKSSGAEAARWSGTFWATLIGGLIGFVGLFKLNHIFITAFNHPTLAALTLAVVTIIWGGVVVGLSFLGARAICNGLEKVGGAVASPLLPMLLVVLGALTVLVVVPTRYAETWDALDLRAPVMALVTVIGAWALVGLTASRLRTASSTLVKAAAPVGVALALVGLLVPTLSFFGSSEDDAPLVYAVRERGLLARVPMGLLQKRFDADGDGYAARLGGGDCDDTSDKVYPGANEIISNGIDEDCDGRDLTPPPSMAKNDAQKPAADGQGDAKADAQGDKAPAAAGDPLKDVRKRHNVVLIFVDTLRWDALGYAGYKRPTSPNLDKLAARSTVFENAYSVSSKTPTAVPPVLASRYPSEMPRSFNHFVIYEPENLFVTEVLKDNGYRTAASAAHWYFQRKYGFAQGFDRWSTYMVKGDEMERIPTSKQVTDTAIEMLKGLNGGGLPADMEAPAAAAQGEPGPWFLYLHYIDPHKHYIDHKGFEPFGRSGRDRYDGEIRFTDHHIGRFLDALEEADPGLKNTIIAFTSDHGEAFGEHEHRFHGRDLYEHQIRVPLIVHVPGSKPARITDRVSLIDLSPTFLDAVGIDQPEPFRGQSLLGPIAKGTPVKPRTIYTEMPPGPYNGVFRSVTQGDWKLIHRLFGNYYRLFNVAEDPNETKDLWKTNKDKANEMQSVYQLFRAQNLSPVEAKKK